MYPVFFRQVNFVTMSFFALKITTCCERKFYHKLARYLEMILHSFPVIRCIFLSGHVFLCFLWGDENRIKPECRELLMFFALSGVVCNLMMTAVATGASYPWYLSKIIDVISILIVGGIFFGGGD